MNLKSSIELMVSLLFISLGMACNSTQNITTVKWYGVDSTITIDGDLKEWEHPLKEPKDYTAIQYNAGNDDKNLYLCVRINDKNIQRRIMGLGLSVYIDTLAKRKDKIGIGYPLALTQEQIEKISFQATKGSFKIDDRALDQAYADICQEFELIGFVEEEPTEKIRVSNLASKELKTAMGFDHVGAMICEFKIPLNQLLKGTINYDEVMSIGIRVNQPAANADDDPGLFNDPSSNGITGSGQLPNPMLQGANQSAISRQPSRSSNGNITGVWAKIQLSKQ
ncbi:hypothetical protein [Aureispira anguillae]|uniref:Lipoprotein n=1 Tax=Aureispira anguillae TaxID=2864201 RepID=A0A915YKS0_9BACT|nr:hypothetical protein [Aureispira anguillae]BDS15029.1 hypothetical protein AsAng_0058110 [Aureispira anguillae]